MRKRLLIAEALVAAALCAPQLSAAQTAEKQFPIFSSFAHREGHCKERPDFSAGAGNRAWIYSLSGKPWRSFMVRQDRNGRIIALDAWYAISATMPRGAAQLVQAVWRPTGELKAGVWWLDVTGPLAKHVADRRRLTRAEQDSARSLAAKVLAECAR